MRSIDHTNIHHSFYLICSICVHPIPAHHQCVRIAVWLHFDLMTPLNCIQKTQILAGPVCLAGAWPGASPGYSGVSCLMQREVAMATGFLLGVRCEALMHEVWLLERSVVHLALIDGVKFSSEVGAGGVQKIENILRASWSRTLLRSYNMNLVSRSITVGGYKTRFRFRTLALRRGPSRSNTSYNVYTLHFEVFFFIIIGVCFYFWASLTN